MAMTTVIVSAALVRTPLYRGLCMSRRRSRRRAKRSGDDENQEEAAEGRPNPETDKTRDTSASAEHYGGRALRLGRRSHGRTRSDIDRCSGRTSRVHLVVLL